MKRNSRSSWFYLLLQRISGLYSYCTKLVCLPTCHSFPIRWRRSMIIFLPSREIVIVKKKYFEIPTFYYSCVDLHQSDFSSNLLYSLPFLHTNYMRYEIYQQINKKSVSLLWIVSKFKFSRNKQNCAICTSTKVPGQETESTLGTNNEKDTINCSMVRDKFNQKKKLSFKV